MATQIEKLRELTSLDRVRVLSSLLACREETKRVYLRPYPDERRTPYEKQIEKDYVFSDSLDFSESYSRLIDFEVIDFGVVINDSELERDPYQARRDMTLVPDHTPPRPVVPLTGSFYGDANEFENLGDGLVADVRLVGIKEGQHLDLYQDLLVEGYVTESYNSRLALFCYFSAIECMIGDRYSNVLAALPKELHFAGERLSLEDKLAIVARAASGEVKLGKREIWGELKASFKDSCELRNRLAHPRDRCQVSDVDLDRVFLALVLVHSVLYAQSFVSRDILIALKGKTEKTNVTKKKKHSR